MNNPLPHLAGRIFGTPLAIHAEKADIILSAIAPRLLGGTLEARSGDAPQRGDYQGGPDGIAVIDISGTLVSKASGMDAMSGLTSYADVAADFAAAIADPMVRGILLDIDSPGGEVKGMFELADAMFGARGQKPVCAVTDCAASAAYMLASSADWIVVSPTGLVGSVGVIALHLDQSAADEKAGLKYTAIYAGARKNDGNPHEPLSPEAHSEMKGRVDKVHAMFTTAVARNRGVKESAVRGAQSAVFMGQDGVDAGLADSVGTFADAHKVLTAAISSGRKSIFSAASSAAKSSVASATRPGETQPMAEVVQPVQAEAKVPTSAEIEAMVTTATQAGRSEASLIASMCAISGHPELIAGFLAQKKTAAEVGAELLKARVEAEKGTEVNTGVMPGADAGKPAANAADGKAKPWKEVLKSMGFLKQGAA